MIPKLRRCFAPLAILCVTPSYALITPLPPLSTPFHSVLGTAIVGQRGEPPPPILFTNLGDSELKGFASLWHFTLAKIDPTEDWHWNERRGYALSAILSYKTDGRLRFRANTAFGGTNSRDWATDGIYPKGDMGTINTKNANKARVYRWNPSLVFVSLGVNDAIYFRGTELTFEDHQKYFGQVLDDLVAHNVTPFVLLNPPRDDKFANSPRNFDEFTVAQESERQVAWDLEECQRRGLPYIDTRAMFGDGEHPPHWLPEYRADGVHWHLPKAAKKLADTIISAPNMKRFLNPFVRVAVKAPLTGNEKDNLLRFACFQGDFNAETDRPRRWVYFSDVSDNSCTVTFEDPPADSGLIGRVVTFNRSSGFDMDRNVAQMVNTGFKPGDTLRFSGKFRASGFGDLYYTIPGSDGVPQPRCYYSMGVRFLDSNGVDLGAAYWARACDNWSIDTEGKWWTFYQDFEVPPRAALIRVEIKTGGTPGLTGQNAKLEVGNLLLKYLGPAGGGKVYP